MVICDEGYQLRQSSNNKLVCRSVNIREKCLSNLKISREDGSWRSSIGAEFPVCAEKGCLYDDLVIQPPENGNVEVFLIFCCHQHYSVNIPYVQVTGRRITYPDNDLSDVATGVYRPGSVLKYTCHPGEYFCCMRSFYFMIIIRSRGCPRGLSHSGVPQGSLGWSGRRLCEEDSKIPAPRQLPPAPSY